MKSHFLPSLTRVALALCLTLAGSMTLTGCLKTRAQMRDDGPATRDDRPVSAPTKEVVPESRYVIEELKSEIVRLTGRIDDLERERKQGDGGAKSEDLKKLEQRLSELEASNSGLSEALRRLQDGPPPSAEPKDLLERARGQAESENHEGVIETLNAYFKKPKQKGAEEAHALRGDAYFALKQYKKAIVDYSEFPEKYAKSTRLPHVLMRLGQSFDALGMKEDAKLFYRDLVEKFPKSSEAKKARAKAK